QETGSNYNSYNHWFIEASAGITKPARSMASGYYSDFNWGAGDLDVRYMFNELFGVQAGVGFNHFEDGSSSVKFHNNMFRAQIEGVVNLGTLLGFRDWTQTINVLG